MPKGHKMSQGYVTVAEGLDYRTISEIMSENGFKMNHATARNVLLSAMRSLATDVLKAHGEDLDLDKVDSIARSPQFQTGIASMMSDLYTMGVLSA